MNLREHIERKLRQALAPAHLEVHDESHMHAVPAGAQSHFKVVVVSEAFQGLPLIQQHRRINELLAEELAGPIHALALHTYTPEQWAARGSAPASPPCQGGSKAG